MAKTNRCVDIDFQKQFDQIGDRYLLGMAKLGLAAGNEITDPEFHREGRRKAGESIHNLVTKADFASELIILTSLHKAHRDALFLAEENIRESGLQSGFEEVALTAENYQRILDCALAFCIDPLDGTAQYARDLYEYSISIGAIERGVHQSGVIWAPETKGGLLVFGSRGKGIRTARGEPFAGWSVNVSRITEDKTIKECVVLYGVDLPKNTSYYRLLNKLATNCQTANSMGSCALGLALVASGYVDGFVQAPQMPWDWAAGYPLVEEAGGKVQFYEIIDGKIDLLDKPEVRHYNPGHKSAGFIAGNPRLVEELTRWLVEDYGRSVE